MRMLNGVFLLLLQGVALARGVDDAAISDADNTAEWLTYGRNHNEQRFSPLTTINRSNVQNLKVDWYLDLPEATGLVSTPLVHAGVMYFVSSRNVAHAVDAVSGRSLWTFDPEVWRKAPNRMKVGFLHGSRGMALWGDKVYFASVDGRLFALDTKTGREVWVVPTIAADKAMYVTGAPKAFRGKILIGNGGTENGPARGYVTAYDAETGEQAWRFWTVPGNPADGFENDAMAMAAKTWTGEWWKHGGGGNAWHGLTYDAEFNSVYIGTGNGSPWNRKIRSPGGGDNLFLCSIVALDADTGAYKWHYQTTPGETWDYNSSMDIVLADLTIDDKPVKALLHAPKNGFFYVIDRAAGRLLSAKPFVEVTWASHVDPVSSRPVENPGVRYTKGPATISPGPNGAHNWPSMSFNPERGLVYIPTLHGAFTYDDSRIDLPGWVSPDWESPVPNEGFGVGLALPDKTPEGPQGSLQAWDPVRQERVWEVPLDFSWNPGTLATAGDLVFQGTAKGDFVAYDAASGKVLWRQHLGLGIAAPPITYALNGRQYIALLVGWGAVSAVMGGKPAFDLGWAYGRHPRRLVVFSLDGARTLPSMPPPDAPTILEAPFFEVDETLAVQGARVFSQCVFCHGSGAVSGGGTPDLRASPIPVSAEAFKSVVRDGAKLKGGMPAFPALSDQHLQALQHYIRQQAELVRN